MSDAIAVSATAMSLWGCPYCGYRSGAGRIKVPGATSWICGECNRGSIILADGVEVSPIGLESNHGPTLYPALAEHPRKGILAHGTPDTRPEGGGEYFKARGIGLDTCHCFICGPKNSQNKTATLINNIAAYVQGKAAGERIVEMFQQGARLDFRKHEPDYVQVKVGACNKHLPQLTKLYHLCAEGILTKEMIVQAME